MTQHIVHWQSTRGTYCMRSFSCASALEAFLMRLRRAAVVVAGNAVVGGVERFRDGRRRERWTWWIENSEKETAMKKLADIVAHSKVLLELLRECKEWLPDSDQVPPGGRGPLADFQRRLNFALKALTKEKNK